MILADFQSKFKLVKLPDPPSIRLVASPSKNRWQGQREGEDPGDYQDGAGSNWRVNLQ
jgi:hypothetical protein